MRSRLNVIVAAAVVFAILCLDLALAARQAAQGGQPAGGAVGAQAGQQGGRGGGGRGGGRGAQANLPPAGPVPRLSNGKPDLSGLWANPYTPNMAGNKGANALDPKTRQPLTWPRQGEPLPDAKGSPNKTFDLPFTEWGLAEWKAYDAEKNGDYAGSCLPFGMSRSINSPHGTQIIHHVDALAFLFEQNTWFHWVPTDPNFKWPVDLPPNWTGVSVGRWDGDTLIIETTGFNGYTRLDTNGHPHSSEVKMINTFTRTDSRTMTHTVTIHDPKTYTQDWMNVRTWRIKPYPDVIMEYSCEENNLGLEDGTITRWKYPENRN
ncbi:MAG: hypothetical protein HY646_11385 [Acidobacteria bacterium]|nr:hypothetical protein [Acidobacteriota bacterium]